MNVVVLVGLCFIGYALLLILSKREQKRRKNNLFVSTFKPSEYPDDDYLRPRGKGLDDWREARYRRER